MKAVFVAAAALLAGGTARADTLAEVGHADLRPASDLAETGCELDIDVRGGIAVIEARHHLANSGQDPVTGALDAELPQTAVLFGASLRDGSGPDNAALAVPGGFQTQLARPGDVVGPDPLVVTAGGTSVHATLEAIAPLHAVTLTLRYAVQVDLENGALRLHLPGRGSAGALPACRATLRAAAGPGATIARVHAGPTIGSGAALAFELGDADVALSADLSFARPQPLLWTERAELGGGYRAELVTAIAPPAVANAPIARRALFVIDASRSMALVGPAAVDKVIDAIAAALPAGIELDAILYDRTAARVLGAWQPAGRAVSQIATAVQQHVGQNGSDLAAALRLAHDAIGDGAAAQTSLIVISDGVLGALPERALTDALDARPSAVDLHVVVLDPGHTRAPGAALFERPIALYGGSYVELSVDALDDSLASVDTWVRPAWLDVAITGLPDESPPLISGWLPSGSGRSALFVTRAIAGPAAAAHALTAHLETAVRVPAAAMPASPALAAMALEQASPAALGGDAARARMIAAHPVLDRAADGAALISLSIAGKVAQDRRAMVAGGGPYARIAAVEDASWSSLPMPSAPPLPPPSAIDRLTLERLFRDQLQPAAFTCYARALGGNAKLAGTVRFELELGRGEVTRVQLAGLGDAAFDACLVDAAYRLTPPMPDLRVNLDDQTIAHYPLAFSLAERRPQVVLGDADSTSPIDIDAIPGGVPAPSSHKRVKVDASTPLGGISP